MDPSDSVMVARELTPRNEDGYFDCSPIVCDLIARIDSVNEAA
jgi:hypothetical protein